MTARTTMTCTRLAWSATTVGGILMCGGGWADTLGSWICDDKGECRTDGVFRFLSKPLLQLYMIWSFGWGPGCLLLFAGAAGLVFLYGTNCARYAAIRNHPLTVTALSVAILAHAAVVAVSSQFFYLPDGTEIRPMGWSMFVFVVSFFSLFIAVPVGIAATIKEKPRFLGFISVVGGLTPLFTAISMLSYATEIKGLKMQS